ncbi:hypothetical protein TNCV_2112681 [Trichonephila clavipes]|nr:hypothetical protein TNCV_2112681 [Trichonephila clavipes]
MTTKSVVNVATNVGYNQLARITEDLDVSLGYNSPCGFHILTKLMWCSSGWCITDQSLCKQGEHVLDWS